MVLGTIILAIAGIICILIGILLIDTLDEVFTYSLIVMGIAIILGTGVYCLIHG